MNTALTINEQHARDMYQAGKHGYTTSDNSWCTPASYYLEDLDAAIRYVGSRSVSDVYELSAEVNSRFVATCGPLDPWSMIKDGTSSRDTAMCAKMYGHVSLAVFISENGYRDWTIIVDGGDCLDIEPVQAIAYLLARFW